MNGKIYDVKGICPTISTNKGEGIKIKSATIKGFESVNEGDSFNFSLPNSKTRRGRVGKKVAQTIQAQNFQATYQNNIVRRLTPKECFKLMDFPGNFIWKCSDNQAYKQAGNSIVVKCLEKIIEKFKF